MKLKFTLPLFIAAIFSPAKRVELSVKSLTKAKTQLKDLSTMLNQEYFKAEHKIGSYLAKERAEVERLAALTNARVAKLEAKQLEAVEAAKKATKVSKNIAALLGE